MQRVKVRGCAVFASDRRWDAEEFPTPGDAAQFAAEVYSAELVDCPRHLPKNLPNLPKSHTRPRGACLGDFWPATKSKTSA